MHTTQNKLPTSRLLLQSDNTADQYIQRKGGGAAGNRKGGGKKIKEADMDRQRKQPTRKLFSAGIHVEGHTSLLRSEPEGEHFFSQ